MSDESKENPFRLPAIGKLTAEEAKHKATNIVNRGGKGINTADPESPSFMVNDQSRPSKLPEQPPPKNINRN